MTVIIKTTFTHTIPTEDTYKVSAEVIETTNIPPEVFVFDVEHETFSHVATVFDLESFPESKEDAIAAELGFYRSQSVTREFSDVALATFFEDVTRNRLKTLADHWNTVQEEFIGEETVTTTSTS